MAAAFSRRFLASALLALALLGTGGCSSLKFWDKDEGDKVIEGSPEQLYRDAIHDIKQQQLPWRDPALRVLEARYPFSEQAKQGQLDLIYAYYKNRRPSRRSTRPTSSSAKTRPIRASTTPITFAASCTSSPAPTGSNACSRRTSPSGRRTKHASRSRPSRPSAAVPEEPVRGRCAPRMIYLRNRLADYEI